MVAVAFAFVLGNAACCVFFPGVQKCFSLHHNAPLRSQFFLWLLVGPLPLFLLNCLPSSFMTLPHSFFLPFIFKLIHRFSHSCMSEFTHPPFPSFIFSPPFPFFFFPIFPSTSTPFTFFMTPPPTCPGPAHFVSFSRT